MSVYEQILDEIVARLKGDPSRPAFEAAGVVVAKSPDDLEAFDKLHPRTKTRVYASFLQDRFGTDENDTTRTVDSDSMDSIKYFNLSIESRKRYGDLGAIDVGQKTMQLLLGYKSQTIGGSLYAFALSFEDFRENIWYYRVVVRWKELPLQPLDSFRVTGDEDTGYFVTEVNFTPDQINVLDGHTTGYLKNLVDEDGNVIVLPEGNTIIKDY